MTAQGRRPFMRLEELLLRHNAITPEQLKQAKEEQAKWGGDLGRIFVDLGYVSEELLMRATAHQLGTRFVDPASEQLDPEIVRAVGVQVCEQFGIIAVGGDLKKKVLRIATSDPHNAQALAQLSGLTGFQIEASVATSASIHTAIRRYYYGEGPSVRDAAPHGPPATAPDATVPGLIPVGAPVDLTPAPAVAHPRAAEAVAPPSPVGPAELEALTQRVARLEAYLGSLRQGLSQQIAADPQIAGLTARLEHLEQISSSDVGSLRAVVELLLERRIFTMDDLKAKVKAVRERSGMGSS